MSHRSFWSDISSLSSSLRYVFFLGLYLENEPSFIYHFDFLIASLFRPMAHHPPAFSSKFEMVVAPATRRPPPTALRLISGPLPSRNKPRHTLPSMPRPAFYPKAHAPNDGPKPRRRVNSVTDVLSTVEESKRLTHHSLPSLVTDAGSYIERGGNSGASSPTLSEGSSYSRPSSPPAERFVRGPWDHASAIKVHVDVESLLPPLRPAAISDGLWR